MSRPTFHLRMEITATTPLIIEWLSEEISAMLKQEKNIRIVIEKWIEEAQR